MEYFISFTNLDLDGYCKGTGGLVSYDFGETNNEELALTFETREEAENWCKGAEKEGWDTYRVKFDIWSYDE
ncbi:MAG: hypothetical protein ACTTHG_02930 [Treponemataceae bacterium]